MRKRDNKFPKVRYDQRYEHSYRNTPGYESHGYNRQTEQGISHMVLKIKGKRKLQSFIIVWTKWSHSVLNLFNMAYNKDKRYERTGQYLDQSTWKRCQREWLNQQVNKMGKESTKEWEEFKDSNL